MRFLGILRHWLAHVFTLNAGRTVVRRKDGRLQFGHHCLTCRQTEWGRRS